MTNKSRSGGFVVRKAGLPAEWCDSLGEATLGNGEIHLRVRATALNYKDALALTARGRVVRTFPLVPGIDLAGEVEASTDARFAVGDRVFATGTGIGEERSGGFAKRACLPAASVSALPAGLSFEEAMGLGTAGFTAQLAVRALEAHGLIPDRGDVLVSGAGGGVGGYAIALLAQRGFSVVALTGRSGEVDYLRGLGATRIIDRAELEKPGKPLASEEWSGAIDTVGGVILANILAATKRGGSVAACGNASSSELPMSVYPFILRGVNLLGIESVHCPAALRADVWRELAAASPRAAIAAMCRTEPLARAPELAIDLLEGRVRGRIVLSVG